MNSSSLIKTALIQNLEKEFNVSLKEAHSDTDWGVHFVLRSKRHLLPFGAFILCHTPPKNPAPAWSKLTKQYPNIPIFCIKTSTMLTEQPEIIKWEQGCQFDPTPINQPTPQQEPAPENYDLYLAPWEKGNIKRFYVNGKGYTPETKTQNLNKIFQTTPNTPVKVYCQNGKVYTTPNTPITPQAEAYIKTLTNQQ